MILFAKLLLNRFIFDSIQKIEGVSFLNNRVVFDTVDWLFKAQSA